MCTKGDRLVKSQLPNSHRKAIEITPRQVNQCWWLNFINDLRYLAHTQISIIVSPKKTYRLNNRFDIRLFRKQKRFENQNKRFHNFNFISFSFPSQMNGILLTKQIKREKKEWKIKTMQSNQWKRMHSSKNNPHLQSKRTHWCDDEDVVKIVRTNSMFAIEYLPVCLIINFNCGIQCTYFE